MSQQLAFQSTHLPNKFIQLDQVQSGLPGRDKPRERATVGAASNVLTYFGISFTTFGPLTIKGTVIHSVCSQACSDLPNPPRLEVITNFQGVRLSDLSFGNFTKVWSIMASDFSVSRIEPSKLSMLATASRYACDENPEF